MLPKRPVQEYRMKSDLINSVLTIIMQHWRTLVETLILFAKYAASEDTHGDISKISAKFRWTVSKLGAWR